MTDKLLKQIIALLVLILKDKREDRPQSELIKDLAAVGLSPKEVADTLDVTPSTVRVALHRARKLRKSKQK